MSGNTLGNRYLCKTCGEIVPGINLARKHSKQGHGEEGCGWGESDDNI